MAKMVYLGASGDRQDISEYFENARGAFRHRAASMNSVRSVIGKVLIVAFC